MTLHHQTHIGSLSLSPDNSLLAVGGQNQDIYIWSLKDQKLLRTFVSPHTDHTGNELDHNAKAVFDINWSNDGTVVAAGFERSVVMLDMRKILSTPIDVLMKQAGSTSSIYPTLSSLGPSGEGGSS